MKLSQFSTILQYFYNLNRIPFYFYQRNPITQVSRKKFLRVRFKYLDFLRKASNVIRNIPLDSVWPEDFKQKEIIFSEI